MAVRAGVLRRLGVLAAAVTMLLTVLVGRTATTEAAWVDSERSTTSATALVVPPPVIVSCSGSSAALGLNPSITLVWQLPPGPYTVDNVKYFAAAGGLLPALLTPLLGSAATTPGPVAGQYTSVFNTGLLTGLLGTQISVGLAVEYNQWQSVRVGRIITFAVAGGPAACQIPA